MDIIQFIAQFFYRIRYWLLWGGFIVTALVAYFTQFLPFSYTVNSNIYAGVTNVTNIDGSKIENISSTFDNLINIAKSKSTLEKVSLRLLATNLVYGEEWQDNMYIQAKHYRQLLQHTPKEVLALVDRSSLDKTVGNLQAYRQESAANFVYSMFSRPTEFYSFHALEQITVKRLGTSDLISFTYTSPDPGITQNTIKILEDELIKAYEILRFSATNSAIAYFEEQVRLAKTNLNKEEDNLMHYNVEHSVINYDNQSKDLAITKYNLDDREELAQRTYKSAVALRRMLEDKMDIRAKIIRDNTKLLKELEKVTELNQNILEQEIFSTDTELKDNEQLRQNRTDLRNSENRISQISDNLNEYNFTKEGVGIDNMVTEWLMACINEAKTKAELKVLHERRNDILNQYREFTPVGTQGKRTARAIGIAVVEARYEDVLSQSGAVAHAHGTDDHRSDADAGRVADQDVSGAVVDDRIIFDQGVAPHLEPPPRKDVEPRMAADQRTPALFVNKRVYQPAHPEPRTRVFVRRNQPDDELFQPGIVFDFVNHNHKDSKLLRYT